MMKWSSSWISIEIDGLLWHAHIIISFVFADLIGFISTSAAAEKSKEKECEVFFSSSNIDSLGEWTVYDLQPEFSIRHAIWQCYRNKSASFEQISVFRNAVVAGAAFIFAKLVVRRKWLVRNENIGVEIINSTNNSSSWSSLQMTSHRSSSISHASVLSFSHICTLVQKNRENHCIKFYIDR